jgi:broad specificity phosphatase PhoE
VTTLLLVRHGETDWNRDGRWQGHADTPLNERGREQARELAATLERVDAVYASDLARARETAEILADRHGLEVRLDARLRERGFGAWEGLTDAEVRERFADAFERYGRGEGHGADDAEPHVSVLERVRSFVDDVLERHVDDYVVVVAHGGSLRVIRALAEGLDYPVSRERIPSIQNCEVFRCAVRDGKLTRID